MSSDFKFDQLGEEVRQRIVDDVINNQNFMPSSNRKPANENVFQADQHRVDFNWNASKNRAKRKRRKLRGK